MKSPATVVRAHGLALRGPAVLATVCEPLTNGGADIEVILDPAPLPSSAVEWSYETRSGMRVERVSDGYVCVLPTGEDFWIDERGRSIRCRSLDARSAASLVDLVLPPVLQLRRALCLHASAFVRGDEAVLLVAPSGSGKSTLASAAVSHGALLLADDAVPIHVMNGVARAATTCAAVNLRADSAKHFGAEAPARHPDKRALPAAPHGGDAPRVVAIIELGSGSDGVALREITGADRFGTLLPHVFRLDPHAASLLSWELDALTELATTVRVLRLEYPRRFDALEGVLAVIDASLFSRRAGVPGGARRETS